MRSTDTLSVLNFPISKGPSRPNLYNKYQKLWYNTKFGVVEHDLFFPVGIK
jgi:hypothetical protein